MASVSFKVKSIYEYTSGHEDDLPFGIGQIITVTDNDDADWYGGEYVDELGVKREGIFPRNFVEKYEPTAPPRPTRVRKKEADHTASSPPLPPAAAPSDSYAVEEPADTQETYEEPHIASPPPLPAAELRSPSIPIAPVAKPPEAAPIPAPVPVEPRIPEPASAPIAIQPASKPATAASARAGPPASEKPISNSFKDRIAAFNKPAAPPVAPFKPSGLSSGSSGFIKKPFVAPPPSRNAYVPPPRDVPTTKVYRRDEDPEIKAKEAEALDNAEKAGLVPAGSSEVQGEDQPKPTSLKERIALLQKQQAEAAQRHAEAVAKKEKPKRPPKKRTESEEGTPGPADDAVEVPPPLERRDTAEIAASKKSIDEPRPPKPTLPARRRSFATAENDGNEADMSGAGDTTEGQEDLTEREDSDEKSRPHTATAPEPEVAEGEEEAEEDVDPEVRRKEELRARMAKMSGGMGFHGMFGPPGMVPMGGPATAKKPKASSPSERRSSEFATEGPSSPRMTAPPVPTMIPIPGMGKPRQQEEEATESDHDEPGGQEITPVVSAQPTGSAQDRKFQPRRVLCLIMTSIRRLTRRVAKVPGAPPPVPGGRPAPPPVPTDC